MKQVWRCPPLRCGAVLSGLVMSTLAMWCRFVQSRDVSLHNFDGLAMSGLAFSVAPLETSLLTAKEKLQDNQVGETLSVRRNNLCLV